MDEFQVKSPSSSGSEDLQFQFESLRHFVLSVLILVIVVAGTLNIYLYYQFKSAGRELDALRPRVQYVHNAYYNGEGPVIERFVHDCIEYGKTHPDFAKYLDKFGPRPQSAPAAPAAAPAPPGSPSPVKK